MEFPSSTAVAGFKKYLSHDIFLLTKEMIILRMSADPKKEELYIVS